MFQALGKEVLYLKRIKFGGISLHEDLEEGNTENLQKRNLNY